MVWIGEWLGGSSVVDDVVGWTAIRLFNLVLHSRWQLMIRAHRSLFQKYIIACCYCRIFRVSTRYSLLVVTHETGQYVSVMTGEACRIRSTQGRRGRPITDADRVRRSKDLKSQTFHPFANDDPLALPSLHRTFQSRLAPDPRTVGRRRNLAV